MRTVFVRDVEIACRGCGSFPVVVRADGGVHLDIMRFSVACFRSGSSEATLRTYSSHLRDFYEQLDVDRRSPTEISLDYLNGYRATIEARASSPYAAQVLRTVLEFLLYLEDRGAISGVIGEEASCAITISRTRNGGIKSSLSAGGASAKSNYCPSDQSIECIKSRGPVDDRLNTRFELMIDWCHVKGLRAKEVCGLVPEQLPDEASIAKALESDTALEVVLTVTKGSKVRSIEVHPLLLARTMKWISTDRRSLVREASAAASRRGVPFMPSGAIFISRGAESALTPKAFSNAVHLSFLEAMKDGDLTRAERVWVHGLRKRMINREVEARPRQEGNLREEALRQETGHGSLEALGRYVVIKP